MNRECTQRRDSNRGFPMSVRNRLASIAIASALAIGLPWLAPAGNAAPAWQAAAESGADAPRDVIEVKRRRRGSPLYVPIVPYLAYDYPYYRRRGFYPEHIGPGYIYYGYPYYYYRKRHSRRCSNRYWRCVEARQRQGRGRHREACTCR